MKILLALLLLSMPASAAERYLVPVLVTVPGAHGALFTTNLAIYNAGETAVSVRGLALQLTGLPFVREFWLDPGLERRFFEHTGDPGVIVTAEGTPDLRMSLRVRDTSRDQLSAGTEIPVVREAEMRRTPVFLLNVPPEGEHYRNRLRIYSFSSGVVEVLFKASDGSILQQTTLSLTISGPGDFRPAFAQIASFPQSGFPAVPQPIRIEIHPVSGTDGVWAFVTTTNNQTQEITIVSPQP